MCACRGNVSQITSIVVWIHSHSISCVIVKISGTSWTEPISLAAAAAAASFKFFFLYVDIHFTAFLPIDSPKLVSEYFLNRCSLIFLFLLFLSVYVCALFIFLLLSVCPVEDVANLTACDVMNRVNLGYLQGKFLLPWESALTRGTPRICQLEVHVPPLSQDACRTGSWTGALLCPHHNWVFWQTSPANNSLSR